MKLRRIHVRRLPGIDEPFVVDGLAPGANLIVGPNGSGKSSLCRAVLALLWAPEGAHAAAEVECLWTDGEQTWLGRREREALHWECDGRPIEAPTMPDARVARCFLIGARDLLDDAALTDRDVAREIGRRMAGGYDLLDAMQAFSLADRHGHRAAKELSNVTAAAERIKRDHGALAVREERLRELDARVDAANRAARERRSLEAASSRGEARRKISQLEREIATLASGVERLRGDERERLAEIERDVVRQREALDESRSRIAEARRVVAEAGLSEARLDRMRLAAWRDRAAAVEGFDAEVRRAQSDAAAAEARRIAAAAELGADAAGAIGVPDAATLDQLESLVRHRERLDLQIEAARARLEPAPDSVPAASSDDLDAALDLLRDWRRLDDLRPAPALAVGAFLAALGILVVGAWIALQFHPAGWALCGLGVALLVLPFLPGGALAAARRERIVRARFGALPVPAPERWDAGSVEARMRGLRAERDRVVAAEQSSQRHTAAQAELRRVEERAVELERERAELAGRLGLSRLGVLALFETATRLAEMSRAASDRTAAAAREAEARSERDKRMNGLVAELADCGVPPPDGVETLRAAIASIDERSAAAARGIQTIERETQAAERIAEELEVLERKRSVVLAGAGFKADDETALHAAVAAHPRFVVLKAERIELERLAAAAEEALEGRSEIVDLPSAELERRIADVDALIAERDGLIEERAEIRREVGQARSESRLEEALLRVAEAREALAEQREEALAATAARHLLDVTRAQYEQAARPEVLRRAEEFFARFTRGRWALRLDADADLPRLHAVESGSGAGRALHELSDGTRMQLLLAARVAFALHADPEGRLPLFLDEALTTTDPERFASVVQCMHVLERESGRQIVYLTSDPSDAERWNVVRMADGGERIATLDLAVVRSLHTAASAEALRLPARPELPDPTGRTPESYGRDLGVPPFDPRRPATAAHLFHGLRYVDGGLELLRRLLGEGIDTLGVWRTVRATRDTRGSIAERDALRIDAVGEAIDAFIEAWNVGRGRPVEAATLREAGVSETYVERLAELVGEHGGDARVLVDALERREDERTKHFRRDKVPELERWLVEHGFLPQLDLLAPAELRACVRARVRGHVERGAVDDEAIGALLDGLVAQAVSVR